MIFSQQRGEWENIGGQSEDTMVEVKGQVGLGLRVWGCNRCVKLFAVFKKEAARFLPGENASCDLACLTALQAAHPWIVEQEIQRVSKNK